MRTSAAVFGLSIVLLGAPAFAQSTGGPGAASPATPAPTGNGATAATPTPQQVEEARQHFQRGVDLYKEGDFRGCLLELRRAQAIAPNYRILFNIAQTHMSLQQYAQARDAYRQYLEQGGATVPPQRKTAVQEELARLEARVGKLDVKSNVAGAEIVIDDELVGMTPLEKPLEVSAGRRKITISSTRGTVTRYIDVGGADTTTAELNVVEQQAVIAPVAPGPATPAPPSATYDPPAVDRPSRSAAPWISLGLTGLFTAGAVTSGILALNAKSELDDRAATPGVSTSRVDDARDNARLFSIGTDVLAGAAIIGAGITTYLFLTQPKQSSTQVGVGPGRVSLSGSF